jgi:hypothetical protein
MSRSVLLAALAALLFAGCNARSNTPPVASGAASAAAAFDAIRLHRDACFGHCPVYDVEIKADGTVGFDGKEYVKSVGPQRGTVSRDGLALLSLAVQHANLAAMRPRYMDESDGCKSVATDAPALAITVTRAGATRTVMLYQGCFGLGALASRLGWLADTIDEVAGTGQWTGDPPP